MTPEQLRVRRTVHRNKLTMKVNDLRAQMEKLNEDLAKLHEEEALEIPENNTDLFVNVFAGATAWAGAGNRTKALALLEWGRHQAKERTTARGKSPGNGRILAEIERLEKWVVWKCGGMF